MINAVDKDHLTTRSHKVVTILSYLLFFVVALRRSNDLYPGFTREYFLALALAFLLLFASEKFLSHRFAWYRRIYFILQLIIVQQLGLFQEYQDTWSLLYVILGFQVALRFNKKEAYVWFTLFILSIFITLSIEFGVLSGYGRAMAWIVIGVFLISYDIQYAQHEDALEESQILLEELKEANLRLEEFSAQAITLAATEERNRMTQKIYDTVGQKIFAIQLAAETSQTLVDTDTQRLVLEIDQLQSQTQTALSEMRTLIGQWREG